MRRLYLVPLLLSLAPLATHAEEIRIGALNIEWLGLPNNRSGIAHGIAQDPADILEYLNLGNVDILSLEEIGDDDEEDATRTNSTLTQAFDLLNTQPAQNWTHVLFPKKNRNDKNQLIGVAWNRSRVQMVGNPFRPAIVDDADDAFNVWDRHPHAVKFSAGANKSDLVLVPLHMKSNVGGAARTRPQRALEAQLLVDQFTAIRQHFEDDDLILLGDSNILRANEPAAARFVSAGFKDLNAADTPTTWSGPAPFARIFVTASQGEFAASVQTVLAAADKADHKRRISDHFMVITTVDVRGDDDVAGASPSGHTGRGNPVTEPGTPPTGTVRILRLLPNPVGNDTEDETATLRNAGSSPLNLAGWRLRDKAGRTWDLSSFGQISPGEEKTIRRTGQAMALNNGGDTVRLLDSSNAEIHRVSYPDAEPGVEISFP